MRTELIHLEISKTDCNPVELDDYSSGSYAVYLAINEANSTFLFFRPDEKHTLEPRCDYILTSKDNLNFASRFIELKGGDIPRQSRCCRTEWDHAFHQLACTYEAFKPLIDSSVESVVFVLCTSIEQRRIAARFKNYKWYKKLQQTANSDIKILYKGDFDIL